jgi:hypothetical protein
MLLISLPINEACFFTVSNDDSGRRNSGFAHRATVKQSHLPDILVGRITKDVDALIISSEFEVTMGWVEPAIHYLYNFDTPFTEVKALKWTPLSRQ